MSTTDPFLPHPHDDDERIAAADPGRGAPEPAPGFGVGGEEPDANHPDDDAPAAPTGPSRTPFRTPEAE